MTKKRRDYQMDGLDWFRLIVLVALLVTIAVGLAQSR